MSNFYGQLDFTNLCRLWDKHKELFEIVEFKDGKHALLKVNFNERKQPDEHGNTHYLKANCKSADQREGVNYYVSSGFKPSTHGVDSSDSQNEPIVNNDLPF